MGELTDKTKGLGNQIAGKTKKAVGDATNDPKLKSEGAAQQAKGKLQSVKGSIEGVLGDKI